MEATLGTLGKPILGLTELTEPSCKFGRLGRPDLGLTGLTELHVNSLNVLHENRDTGTTAYVEL